MRITSKTLYERAEVMQKDGLDIGISGAYGGWKVTNAKGSKELSHDGYDSARYANSFLDGVSEGATQMQKRQEQRRIDRASSHLKRLGLTVVVEPVNENWNVPAYDATISAEGVDSLANPSGIRVADFLDDALDYFLQARTVKQKQRAFAKLRSWLDQQVAAKADS